MAETSAQTTDRVLTCYRIGDPDGAFPIYDAEGARLYPGRWNTRTSPIIYTSEHYSTAMLEKLVHANLILPANQHSIAITIPNGISYEVFQTAAHPGWDLRNEEVCKTFGQDWYERKRSALLIVPSISSTPRMQLPHQPRSPGREKHNSHDAGASMVG